jgi:hypothetical protein
MGHIFWYIYEYSIIGTSLYILLLTLVINIQFKKKIEESYKNHPYYMAFQSYENAPFYYKLLLVFLPVINTFFTLLFISATYMEIRHAWFNFGRRVVGIWSRNPDNMKFFRQKVWFIRVFFNRWTDYFFKRYEYDIIERVLKRVLKKQADEKQKKEQDGKSQPEPESETKQKPVKEDPATPELRDEPNAH